MEIIKSNLQKLNNHLPDKITFKNVAYQRGLIASASEMDDYQKDLSGAKGEELVVNYLEKYGKSHWKIIRNMWMDYKGPFERDIILLTRNKCYVFEVKNYSRMFTYENGICKLGKYEIDYNCVEQTRRAAVKMNRILKRYPGELQVEHAILFANADCFVQINSEVPEIQIVPRYFLREYIEGIIGEEDSVRKNKIDPQKLLQHFEQFEIADPFYPLSVTNELSAKIKKGIYCPDCLSYDLIFYKNHTRCICGFKEVRTNSILRTIEDFSILYFEELVQVNNVYRFFNGEISKPYLIKVLNKNFDKNGDGRYLPKKA